MSNYTTAINSAVKQLRQRANQEHWSSWQLAFGIHQRTGLSLLASYRRGRGWMLEETATYINEAIEQLFKREGTVTKQRLCKWEKGDDRPSEEHLDALCYVFKTRPDRLGFGTDYTPPGELDGGRNGDLMGELRIESLFRELTTIEKSVNHMRRNLAGG